MRKKETVTIRDVAEQSGYSVSAVCLALSHKGRIGSEACKKILDTAAALNYKPNRAAQSLSRKEVAIGIVIPGYPDVIQDTIEKSLVRAMDSYREYRISYKLCKYEVRHASGEDATYLEQLLNSGVDGLIIEIDNNTSPDFIRIADMINKSGIPVVSLVVNCDFIDTVCSVSVNAEVVGKLAAQYLSDMCCRNALIFSGFEISEIHKRNIAGFKCVAENSPLSLNGVYYTDDLNEKAYELVKSAIGSMPDTDGIFVTSYLAPSVCDALHDIGAENVSVIGVDLYDDIIAYLESGRMCASIYQNQTAQAQAAVDSLIDIIYARQPSKADTKKSVSIKPELVLRSALECYK